MNIRIEDLGEPELEFGQGELNISPKMGLPVAGPFASDISELEPRVIRLGLVALPSEVSAVRAWFEKLHKPILSEENNVKRFKEFPGVTQALRCRFEIPERFIRRLDEQKYAVALQRDDNSKFESLLELFKDSIKTLFGDSRPDCILVCFPDEVADLRIENPRLSYEERELLKRANDEEQSLQLSLFEPSEREMRAAAEMLPRSEELLFRNFHRALKASCMCLHNAVPLQIMRRQTYISREAKQSDSTRAWNLCLALYYKSGNIPWRPAGLTKDTCYIGISFHHLKRRSGDLVYASVANAFTNESEPFILKGATIPRGQVRGRGKQPYLTEPQASALMESVIDDYESRFGTFPTRVVVHKTTRYQPEEEQGIRNALLSKVSGCELVWMSPTGFRLLRRGFREPLRGTYCTVESHHNYLYTTGYVTWWGEYPGPHIPAPLEFGACGKTNLAERAREILALTKMNWNNADGIGRFPITIQFARKVGVIMTEMDDNVAPNPLYRFYM